jgi:hypothetical protein
MRRQSYFATRVACAVLLASLVITLYPAKARNLQSVMSSRELQATLHRVSLKTKHLAAAGLSGLQVATLFENAETFLQENSVALEMTDSTASTAHENVLQLRQLIVSGKATQEDVNSLNSAATSLQNKESARDQILQGLFEAATEDLSAQVQTTLTTIRANADWELPVEFLTVNRTEAQWIQLRDALAAERISQKRNYELESDVSAFLAEARSNPSVSTAAANLQANSVAVHAAWTAAANQE